MPTSSVQSYTGASVAGAIFIVAVAATVLTVIASAFLLWRYRRAVQRLMEGSAKEFQDAGGQPESRRESSGCAIEIRRAGRSASESAERLHHWTQSGPRRQAWLHAVSALVASVFLAVAAFLAFSQVEVNPLRAATHPLQFVFLLGIFVWPILLTVNIVAASGATHRWLMVVAYFVLLALVGTALVMTPTERVGFEHGLAPAAWSGETPARLFAKWSAFNLAPTLLIAAFRRRRIRAVAPLVLAFMTAISAGVFGAIGAAFVFRDISVAALVWASEAFEVSPGEALTGYLLLLAVLAMLLFGMLGWGLMVWIRRGYERRSLSEQTLAVDALWAVFAAFYAVGFVAGGPFWALAAVAAFFIVKATRAGAARQMQRKTGSEYKPALLVLRVFALGRRSETLFEAVTKRWRYIGPVRLIGGLDLAHSTVAPRQFLAFVTGRLDRLFISNERAAANAVAALDDRPARDGRSPVQDFFCHADTWQGVLEKLIARTNVALMDLRSLSAHNAGCVFEIKALLHAMPFSQLVFVVDDRTDRDFLARTIDETCRELPSDSPNFGRSPSALEVLTLSSGAPEDVDRLLRRLCGAAAAATPTAAEIGDAG